MAETLSTTKIGTRLEKGCDAAVNGDDFCVLTLCNLAKSARRGKSKLTIVLGEKLSDTDLDEIYSEAPSNVAFDYLSRKFSSR